MDTGLFLDILRVDSTSGKELALAKMLAERFKTERNELEISEVGDGTQNLFFTWGTPRVVFCTHMDTVPPYILPTLRMENGAAVGVDGRGACDAKGQLFAMWSACSELERRGCTGFGLLLLAGEETGSYGAKAFTATHGGLDTVIVGEPTDNCMTSACKGTKSFGLTFKGTAFHSGYPEHGASAVERFIEFMNALGSTHFPEDEILGATSYNVGMLHSDNPQNILSPELTCRIYFRTTFASDEMVKELLPQMASERPWLEVEARGGDTPARYLTIGDIPTKTVSFGSDAPQLHCFRRKALCGAGSILVAHRDEETITFAELQQAIDNYIEIYNTLDK